MTVRLCNSCDHSFAAVPGGELLCRLAKRRSMVDGSETFVSCVSERMWDVADGCGPKGKRYQEKKESDGE